jgi:Na+/proline symporter
MALKLFSYRRLGIATAAALGAEGIVLGSGAHLQWHLLILYGWLFIAFMPVAGGATGFYRGRRAEDRPVGFFTLAASAYIAWIFGKSLTNASTLGGSFGVVGGVAYAAYYLSFFVAAFVIYRLRTRCGFRSLPEAVESRFGRSAAIVFALAVSIRLLNEVWSNSAVVADFYGPAESVSWWHAALAATAIPATYVQIGGLRASLLSDVIQAVLAVVLLGLIVGILLPRTPGGLGVYIQSGHWTLGGGVDLLLVALIQIWSYPFHDPVLTDRGFLAEPNVMWRAFVAAGLLGVVTIVLFSFLGIFGTLHGVGGMPADVARYLGLGVFSLVNLIMMASSISTLDSTFSSTSKLVALEATGYMTQGRPLTPADAQGKHLRLGKIAVVAIAILGLLPLLADPAILSATTLSGTMVIGLAPVFLLLGWLKGRRPLAFHVSFWTGLAIGVLLSMDWLPGWMQIGHGHYAALLGANLYGSLLCLILFVLAWTLSKGRPAPAAELQLAATPAA